MVSSEGVLWSVDNPPCTKLDNELGQAVVTDNTNLLPPFLSPPRQSAMDSPGMVAESSRGARDNIPDLIQRLNRALAELPPPSTEGSTAPPAYDHI